MQKMASNEAQVPLSIGAFLDRINAGLRKFNTRIIGEISELTDYGGQRNYIFFKIKGKDESGDTSVLTCMMWQRNYAVSGVRLEVGMEVILTGYADIYKPGGRFSFQAETVELAGEGALKKAYDDLKKKLQGEGLFEVGRKRSIPDFPHRIGLITSKDGAAIDDFKVNLGRHGFHIRFVDSRVEGQLAIHDLLSAVKTLRKENLDVLVIVRGGGSLEALLPFNNEALVREIVDFPVPVVAGIGHERDVSLVCLAADCMVSTPSMAAQTLSEPWLRARHSVELQKEHIFHRFEQALISHHENIDANFDSMRSRFQIIFDQFAKASQAVRGAFTAYRARLDEMNRVLPTYSERLQREMHALIRRTHTHVKDILPPAFRLFLRSCSTVHLALGATERLLESHNPERQLRLGYSIVQNTSGVIKNVMQLTAGAEVHIRMYDGTFDSRVERIQKNA